MGTDAIDYRSRNTWCPRNECRRYTQLDRTLWARRMTASGAKTDFVHAFGARVFMLFSKPARMFGSTKRDPVSEP